MLLPIDEVAHFDVTTHEPSTGAVSDADSAPTFDVFEEATDTPILDDQTMTKRTSLTGNYRGTFTASAANGFEAGKWYSVVVSATVDSIAAKHVAMHFRVAPAESAAGVPKADVSHWLGTAAATPTVAGVPEVDVTHFGGAAGSFASGVPAVNAAQVSGDAPAADTLELFAEALDQSTGQLDAGSFASGAFDAVWTVATRTLTAFDAAFKTGYSLSSAGVQAIWDALTSALTTVGSIGKLLVDNVNATISSRASQTSVDDLPTNAELATALASADDAVLAALAVVDLRLRGTVMAQGTIGSTGNSTTALHLAGLTYGDDELNDYLLVVLDVSAGEYHARWVSDWADAGDLATVATLPFTPENAVDTYWLLPIRRDVTGSAGPSAADIADAVWEEPIADHSGVAGSTAEQLAAAGAAGDPWATALPGSYTSGQAGKIVGDNINATVSSRATQASVDAVDDLVDDLESRLGTPANLGGGATIAQNLSDIEGQTDDIGVAGAGLTAIPDSAGVTTLLSRIPAALFSGITSLAQWLGLIAGKQTGNSTARTELRATGAGSGTFDETADSQEAIRDRGDAAWTTATGFSTHTAADVWAVATRVLTAGTNIALAKGTGVTGFNDLSAAQVNAEVDQGIADAALATAANLALVDAVVDAVKVVTDALGATAAARLKLSGETILPGTVDSTGHTPTTTEFEADDITEATADHFIGRIVIFTSGALQYQATDITDYALASGRGHFTVTTLTEAPANNDSFVIV